MQAPATTGPASGAQPASSTPASGCGNSSSSLKEQRRGMPPYWSFPQKREPRFSHPRFRWHDEMCGLLLHPPWRKAAVLAGMIEEDDVAVGIAEPCLAPHPRLVPGTVLERDSAPRQLLDALVEVVTFEIDGGSGGDLLLGVDLDRQGDPSARLESGVAVFGAVDDLLEAEAPVEIHRAIVFGPGHCHLIEPRPAAGVEPDIG